MTNIRSNNEIKHPQKWRKTGYILMRLCRSNLSIFAQRQTNRFYGCLKEVFLDSARTATCKVWTSERNREGAFPLDLFTTFRGVEKSAMMMMNIMEKRSST